MGRARDHPAIQGHQLQRTRRGTNEGFLAQHRLAVPFITQRKTCLAVAYRGQLIAKQLFFKNRDHVERKPQRQAAARCRFGKMAAHQGQYGRRLGK